MKDIIVVTATRVSEQLFWSSTLLGRSLKRITSSGGVQLEAAFKNSDGLPQVYNRAIIEANRDHILLFVHDDVFIDDYWLVQRLNEAVERFDVAGIVGNTRLAEGHIAWPVTGMNHDGSPVWDDQKYFSGRVAYLEENGAIVTNYGASPKECKLLDGLFIAVAGEVLLDKVIRFDEQFDFNFYDLDFCRTCLKSGLKVGTWPIAVTHKSGGEFGSPQWQSGLEKYRQKWN